MKTLFAVPWIEIEFGWGERYEGYKIFENLEDCIQTTKYDSDNGNGKNYYIGPIRPLYYYEIADQIEEPYPIFVDTIKFKSDKIYINK